MMATHNEVRSKAMISKRSFLFRIAIGAAVIGWPHVAAAQQALGFDEFWKSEGGYTGIIHSQLKTNDPKIISFVKREGEKYILSGDDSKKKYRIEEFGLNLGDILANSRGAMPAQSSVDFFMKNAPQLLIEFVPYEREFPNLASKGKLALANQNLQRANQDLQRANQDLQRAQDLNRRLTGQKP
jgi:hypothetical protein